MVEGAAVDKIGLVEAVAALRSELRTALERASGEELTFPVEGIQLELQIGVTHDAEAHGGIRFWVVELGADASVVREQVQRITIDFGTPMARGETVAVGRALDEMP